MWCLHYCNVFMQAAVNANCLFVDVEVGFKGPTHDSTILKSSKFGAFILTLAASGWGVLGDAIYELGRNLWTPFRGKPEEQPQYMRSFNKAHSRARIHVCLYGVLKFLTVFFHLLHEPCRSSAPSGYSRCAGAACSRPSSTPSSTRLPPHVREGRGRRVQDCPGISTRIVRFTTITTSH